MACVYVANMLWLVIVQNGLGRKHLLSISAAVQPPASRHTHVHVCTHTHAQTHTLIDNWEEVQGYQMAWAGAKRELWLEGNHLMELYSPISSATHTYTHIFITITATVGELSCL